MSKPVPSTHDKIIVDRTKSRSAASQTVSDLRQRLTSNSGEPIAYEKEMFVGFAQNNINASIATSAFASVITFFSYFWVGAVFAGYWLTITVVAYMGLRAVAGKFLSVSHNIENSDLPQWRQYFFLAQLVIAACWTVLVFSVQVSGNDTTFSIIIFASILVLQASTMMLSYGLGAKVLMASAPPSLLLAGIFAFSLQPAMLAMAAILIGSQVFFFIIANRLKLSVISILEHKDEREALIAELETARGMSEEARRRAEEANLAKSRFLATMSHELRTPLNAILGFSEVIRDEVLGPVENATYKDYIQDIHSSGQHLLNLINEILDLSRIEAGRHELSEEAVKLQHIVEESQNMVQLKAKSKGVRLITQIEENLPQLWADERAVRQIVLNLLSNAMKFTPTGGSVTIKLGWTASGGQYVSIRDTGPGIPEEEIPIVLSSFGQGSIAIKSAEQGTGLGLPIVQALVHMHDGKFELTSKLREGTEVVVTFPRSRILEVMPPVQGVGGDMPQNRSRPAGIGRSNKRRAAQSAVPTRTKLPGEQANMNSRSLVENARASLNLTARPTDQASAQ